MNKKYYYIIILLYAVEIAILYFSNLRIFSLLLLAIIVPYAIYFFYSIKKLEWHKEIRRLNNMVEEQLNSMMRIDITRILRDKKGEAIEIIDEFFIEIEEIQDYINNLINENRINKKALKEIEMMLLKNSKNIEELRNLTTI